MDEYLNAWAEFFDHYAGEIEKWHRRNSGYHAAIAKIYRSHISQGSRVLEVGSGNGDLLAAIRPDQGVGVDISGEMTSLATRKYPNLRFVTMSAEALDLSGEQFDYIVLSDLLGYAYDIRLVFERLRPACHARTRIIINWYSRLWQPILNLAERLGLKYPQPILNWTTVNDIFNLLQLADFQVVLQRSQVLLPRQIPFLTPLINGQVAGLPWIRHLCLTHWIVARPMGLSATSRLHRVSVICPCRNEAGNIEKLVARIPEVGAEMELLFVEGHSKDDTLDECYRVAKAHSHKNVRVYRQPGQGKADAVRKGFSEAKGDILIILDTDLSVAPEDLPQFYEALASGKGEFVNGSRRVYAMDPGAMRFLNLLGNRLFAALLSWLIGQPIKDALCGTKALWRSDFDRISHYEMDHAVSDPFGDFELLLGAAKLNLKIVEIPVRYRERSYGNTNISRFGDGWLLLRIVLAAARRR